MLTFSIRPLDLFFQNRVMVLLESARSLRHGPIGFVGLLAPRKVVFSFGGCTPCPLQLRWVDYQETLPAQAQPSLSRRLAFEIGIVSVLPLPAVERTSQGHAISHKKHSKLHWNLPGRFKFPRPSMLLQGGRSRLDP